jgi:hypothetical protein
MEPIIQLDSYQNCKEFSDANVIHDYPADVPPRKSRYQRRSSVTRYSLDQMSLSPSQPILATPSLGNESDPTHPHMESNCAFIQVGHSVQKDPCTTNAPDTSHRRYSRRSSVTRYSISQGTDPITAMETRSLSPVPLSRRATAIKVKVEAVDFSDILDENTLEDNIPTKDVEPVKVTPGTTQKSRYPRRCSVTKYCLEGSSATPSSCVKVTVEEPLDTIESMEHRSMLANDIVESSGAGDLLVGWNQAGAAFFEKDDQMEIFVSKNTVEQMDLNQNMVEEVLISEFGEKKRTEVRRLSSSSSTLENKREGSYILDVISKPLCMARWWFRSLESEVKSTSQHSSSSMSLFSSFRRSSRSIEETSIQ